MNHLNDHELIELLRSSTESKRDSALRELYRRNFHQALHYVREHGGHEADAEDVFQDSLIVLYHQVRENNLHLSGSLGGYLMGISRNLWLKQVFKRGKQAILPEVMPDTQEDSKSVVEVMQATEAESAVSKLLREMGGDCKKVLLLFYFEKMSMKDIQTEMSFGSEQVAKNKKMGCLKKLREMAWKSGLTKSIFSDY